MLNVTAIVFFTVFALEAVVIIVGNAFTIFVFWTQRHNLKRLALLLINLAVADLLVGVAEAVVLVSYKIHNLENQAEVTFGTPLTFQVFGSGTSVLFLALVSLERVYAVLWPLRHRVTNTQVYIYSVVTVWVAGLCISGLRLLTIYHKEVDSVYATVAEALLLSVSLLVICTSYLTIRSRLHCTAPELQVHNRNLTEQNLRISKTCYIAVAASLIFWLPAFVVYAVKDFCWDCFSLTVLSLVYVLHLANSMVNPFVYSFRMPIFKDALKKCWHKKRQQNIELRDISSNPLHNKRVQKHEITAS